MIESRNAKGYRVQTCLSPRETGAEMGNTVCFWVVTQTVRGLREPEGHRLFLMARPLV